jgi:hypothetical protein
MSACYSKWRIQLWAFRDRNPVSEKNEPHTAYGRPKLFSLSSVTWRLLPILYLASSKDGEERQPKPSKAVQSHSSKRKGKFQPITDHEGPEVKYCDTSANK